MKKVIYACFLLVASMSIVSCEKEKKESKEEYLIDKIEVYIDGEFLRDTTFYYKDDSSLDYKRYRRYESNGEISQEYNIYYDKYGNILKVEDPIIPTVYNYTYKNSKIDTIFMYCLGEYLATKKCNYYDNGYLKEQILIDIHPVNGISTTSNYYSLPYYDEYNNYVVDVEQIAEDEANEPYTYVKVLDYNSENEYDENGLVIKKSYYYPDFLGTIRFQEIYMSYKKK